MVRFAKLASAALVGLCVVGCQSESAPAPKSEAKPVTPPVAQATTPAVSKTVAQPVAAVKAIRINCGATAAMKDSAGNQWMPDSGFVDGETIERGDIKIENTTIPQIYQTEHFGMTAFSCPVPNGKYSVKLHFAETFDGVTAAGERIFSVNVEGTDLKDIDPFKEAGGMNKALVKTVPVEIKDGKLDLTFTANVQSPEINGIEILPQ